MCVISINPPILRHSSIASKHPTYNIYSYNCGQLLNFKGLIAALPLLPIIKYDHIMGLSLLPLLFRSTNVEKH